MTRNREFIHANREFVSRSRESLPGESAPKLRRLSQPIRARARAKGGRLADQGGSGWEVSLRFRFGFRSAEFWHTTRSRSYPGLTAVFSNLKTWIRGTFHGVSRKHLQRYLEEFNYRFDRRWKETELFYFVLRRAVGGEPLPYARLTAEVIG